jgi:asparagine synthase (glutamine-hydrolysing)
MCGIAGIMTTVGASPASAMLEAMGKAMHHRGPDGSGHYVKGNVGMVQTRLAIIDLATGDQPLYGPDGTALVANGEIYNYIELRAAMADAVFKTASDCELPLHLYPTHGFGFARYLRGMYAIALHDPASARLILARDPFGIKPLYYAETAQGFAFASEPEVLIASGFVKAELALDARDELLQMQFTTGRDTIFKGIQRVLPGETLIVERGHVAERRQLPALPENDVAVRDENAALDALDNVLEDSVKVHQRSDVPYGMFLSGGVDSSVVLAMMARLNTRPVKTFTAGFAGTNVADERPLARKVAENFGAEQIEVEFGAEDFWRLLPEIAGAMDDPAADYAILPTYKLAAAARDAGLKVILSGEGGDELFGGYGRYRSAMRPWWRGGRRMRRRGTLERLGILRQPLAGWRDGMAGAERMAKSGNRTRLQIAQAVDCADWLPNDLLTKLDRCLMAHGIEGRTPFLDPAVAAFAYHLPDDLKVRDGMGKYLLRRWLAQKAPVAEPFSKKRGFTVPVGEWIAARGAQLGPLVAAQESLREICRPDAVTALFRDGNRRHAGFATWALLFYALWHRRHILRQPTAPDVFAALGG